MRWAARAPEMELGGAYRKGSTSSPTATRSEGCCHRRAPRRRSIRPHPLTGKHERKQPLS
ncbi:hypothetical protein DAI22_01g148800 [Oryza sativa Japonica Group]|nr:hypothetical protein DAI22_01g148800 [Oryza sativa Japonica Group]